MASVPAWTIQGHQPAAWYCQPCQFPGLSKWRLRKDLTKWCLKQLGMTKKTYKHRTQLTLCLIFPWINCFQTLLLNKINRRCHNVFILLQIDNNNTKLNRGLSTCHIRRMWLLVLGILCMGFIFCSSAFSAPSWITWFIIILICHVRKLFVWSQHVDFWQGTFLSDNLTQIQQNSDFDSFVTRIP